MIHRVSCVSAVQRFILSPDVLGLYQNAQSAVESVRALWLTMHVPCKVLGILRTTTALLRAFMKFNLKALCNSYVNSMLRTDINITETTYSCQF